jgi:HSP20 family protein
MSSSRWDPWGDIISLREAMSNLLEESFVRPRTAGGPATGSLGLAVDLLETPSVFVLTASVPGVKPTDVAITVLGDTVTIAGQRDEPRTDRGEPERNRWLIRERHFGNFDRSVKLPAAVKPDEATADFEDGVLTVVLPKADEAKPRTIAVRSIGNTAGAHEIDVQSTPSLSETTSVETSGDGTAR